jgi:hypothetical protein
MLANPRFKIFSGQVFLGELSTDQYQFIERLGAKTAIYQYYWRLQDWGNRLLGGAALSNAQP